MNPGRPPLFDPAAAGAPHPTTPTEDTMSYPTLFTTPGVRAFAEEIDAERQRQLAKWGDQHHPDGTGGSGALYVADRYRTVVDHALDTGTATWRDIVLEEVYEALGESDPDRLRAELVQVAAVCAAWIADLGSRQADGAGPTAPLPPVAVPASGSVRELLLAAIDGTRIPPLGYGSPEELLAAYDASRTSTVDETARPVAEARDRLRGMALSLATGSGPLVEPGAFDAALDDYRDAVLAAPTDRSALRKAIAHAIHRYDNHHALSGNDVPSEHHYGEADAVLAVLPAAAPAAPRETAAAVLAVVEAALGDTLASDARAEALAGITALLPTTTRRDTDDVAARTLASLEKVTERARRAEAELKRLRADRAAVLREAADHLLARCPHLGDTGVGEPLRRCPCVATEELRRMADETAATETEGECTASRTGACLREAGSETACDTEAGECVHGGQPAAGARQDGAQR